MDCKIVRKLDKGLTISRCDDPDDPGVTNLYLDRGRGPRKKQLATLELSRYSRDGSPTLVTGSSFVHRVEDWSKGYGTMLYEAGLRLACEEQRAYSSSSMRSVFSESFWGKQARKGRAACVPGEGTYYRLPLDADLEEAYLDGRISEETFSAIMERAEALLAQRVDDAVGEKVWPCKRYLIPAGQTCSIDSLKGLRGRKAARRSRQTKKRKR